MRLLAAVILSILFIFMLYEAVNLFPLKHYDVVKKIAENQDIDPLLVMAFIRVESNFRENAISPLGAKGLMQVMDDTAKWLSEKTRRELDLTTPASNIEAGVLYFRYLLEKYNDIKKAIKAYNIGPNAYDSSKNMEAARRYYRKIMLSYLIYRFLYRPPK